ncbi:MAG: TRAM domain-containing protein, partial [Kiritimatiellaeota bacterium]|nr:TRAM domain-containing protein [Kiritimatiellota bacterium]
MSKKRERKTREPEKRPVELEITSVAYGGRGIGRLDCGKVVFTSGTLPGERVLVELAREHADYFDGLLLKVLTPSSERAESDCM